MDDDNSSPSRSAHAARAFRSRNAGFRALLARAWVAARSDAVILLTGEPGAGKTLLAETVHRVSRRRGGPFVVADGSAFEESILCGELFGFVRGAFSGASASRTGLLESAHGGTVFLDEIDKLSLIAQGRLLRAIEAKRIRPLGANQERPLDVRFLCASNRSLPDLVNRREFLTDLYHRISDLVFSIPPLRERPEDLRFLFERFLREERESLGRSVPRIEEETWPILRGHHWTGNIRELRQVARRLAIFCNGRVTVDETKRALSDSGPSSPFVHPSAGLREKMRGVESELIRRALHRSEGNLSRAARELRLSPQALHYKIRRLGIHPHEARAGTESCEDDSHEIGS